MTTSKGSTFNRRKGVRFHPSLTHSRVLTVVYLFQDLLAPLARRQTHLRHGASGPSETRSRGDRSAVREIGPCGVSRPR